MAGAAQTFLPGAAMYPTCPPSLCSVLLSGGEQCEVSQQILVEFLLVLLTQPLVLAVHPVPPWVTSSLFHLPCPLRTTGQLLGSGLPAPLCTDAVWPCLLLQPLLPAG